MSEKRKNGKTGFIVAIASLSVVIASLAMVCVSLFGTNVNYKNQLENGYQRAFFDLTANMNNLEVKLSKLMVTKSHSQVQKNLSDVSRQTDNTQSNLAQLPASHETINKTMRFVNQLGDYSSYLSGQVAAGKTLSEENYEVITNLHKVNAELSRELGAMASKLGTELKIMPGNGAQSGKGNALDESFGNMQETSVEYPKMIYDGPFSDSMLDVELKLGGEELNQQQAQQAASDLFRRLSFSEVSFKRMTEGKITTYDFDIKLASGGLANAQISKIGGYPVMLDNSRTVDNFSLEIDECVKIAEEFAKELGFDTHKSVWASDYDGAVYINLAPHINDVIYYPDLVKIIVARDNGEILGLESMTYLANHKERSIESPKLSLLEARQKISDKIDIVTEKLALVPQPGNKEVLAYEFAGNWNQLKYFIYIDANTGDEVDIFRVIDSDEGTFMI